MADELKKLDLSGGVENVVKPVIATSQKVNDEVKKAGINWRTLLIVVVLGVASGFGLFKVLPGQNATTDGVSSTGKLTTEVKVGDVIGSNDESTFKDSATGVLEIGTLSGEGSHSLLREGGPSKTANLTSSVIDLDQFVGDKIEVWGETFAAQKSGWLMDVGRVKVIELNAQKPQ